VLIEALRATQLGLVGGRHYNAKVVALERLAGEAAGGDWLAWVTWYAGTSLSPPPGFAAFKGRLFARIDPAFAPFFAEGLPSRVRSEELLWSGSMVAPERAGAIPRAHPAAEAHLDPEAPVVGVALGGEARAWPLGWLDWHEVANDRVGGRAIAVAWCAYCGSATAFASDGRTFGASGLVLRGVRLMYDHETHTLWDELTGAPLVGPAAASGARLDPVPAVLTTFRAWRERHPETTVVALAPGDRTDPANPYGRYHTTAETVFPVHLARTELAPKAWVYGLEAGLRAKAWPLDDLIAKGIVNDEVGGHRVALVATRGRIELEGTHPRAGKVRFSPGAELRAYARGEVELSRGEGPDDLVDEQGRAWRATDAELLGPAGERFDRLPGTLAYWFAWQAFHPATDLSLSEEPR
jgi:hypothetical protein